MDSLVYLLGQYHVAVLTISGQLKKGHNNQSKLEYKRKHHMNLDQDTFLLADFKSSHLHQQLLLCLDFILMSVGMIDLLLFSCRVVVLFLGGHKLSAFFKRVLLVAAKIVVSIEITYSSSSLFKWYCFAFPTKCPFTTSKFCDISSSLI